MTTRRGRPARGATLGGHAAGSDHRRGATAEPPRLPSARRCSSSDPTASSATGTYRPPTPTPASCSYECTFCADCVEYVLHGVCPNCGGGFKPRPIRPLRAWREGTGLAHDPPGDRRRPQPLRAGPRSTPLPSPTVRGDVPPAGPRAPAGGRRPRSQGETRRRRRRPPARGRGLHRPLAGAAVTALGGPVADDRSRPARPGALRAELSYRQTTETFSSVFNGKTTRSCHERARTATSGVTRSVGSGQPGAQPWRSIATSASPRAPTIPAPAPRSTSTGCGRAGSRSSSSTCLPAARTAAAS